MRAPIAFLVPLVFSVAASAVLLDGWDGSRDVAPFPIAVLANVGVRGGLTAIYLGNGIVLTANHVGAGDVSFGGTVYPYVPDTAVRLQNADGTYADLLIFEIYPRPDLPELEIASAPPDLGSLLVVAGNGYDRGTGLVWDPNGTSAPGPTAGYAWANGSHLRWGTNNVEVFPAGRVSNTQAFGSFFDPGQFLPEAQAVTGDSGGAAFTVSPLIDWQLSGVIICISLYSGQPPNTTFFGQKTYYADVTAYRSQLTDAVDLPEPGSMRAPGTALLALLARRRRTRQPLQPVRVRRNATASRSVLSLPIG